MQPIPAQKHGTTEFLISGQTVDATYLPGSTVPRIITGLPGLTIRFGTSHDGMLIGIQLVSKLQAETMILHLASLLEPVSTIRDLGRPSELPSVIPRRQVKRGVSSA